MLPLRTNVPDSSAFVYAIFRRTVRGAKYAHSFFVHVVYMYMRHPR